jgi:7-carboxy-7-deazaguanine synthase
MEKSVKLIENFVSFQGEGINGGRRCIILRFKKCNRNNCLWCDTAVKMRISQEGLYSLDSIQEDLYKNSAILMVTGGEPTFDPHFDQTVMLLNDLIYPLANVETNGYRLPELISKVNPEKPINYIFSPKIFNEDDYDFAIKRTKELTFNPNVFFKIVYEDNSLINDYLTELSTILSVQSNDQFSLSKRVWIMPEGTTREKLIENSGKVFEICEKYNFSFSSRNHIIYGFI